ncbi:MAG: hypothetical protein ACLRSW_11525 [Christensenellaceae bacterium]
MKAVVQRVKGAALRVDGRPFRDSFGLVVFFGVRTGTGKRRRNICENRQSSDFETKTER